MDRIQSALMTAATYLMGIDHRAQVVEALVEYVESKIAPAAEGAELRYSGGCVEVSGKDFKIMLDFMRAKKKIQAIKHLRTVSGIGLREAKDAVENPDNGFPQFSPER